MGQVAQNTHHRPTSRARQTEPSASQGSRHDRRLAGKVPNTLKRLRRSDGFGTLHQHITSSGRDSLAHPIRMILDGEGMLLDGRLHPTVVAQFAEKLGIHLKDAAA